jgi:hypothetical protein
MFFSSSAPDADRELFREQASPYPRAATNPRSIVRYVSCAVVETIGFRVAKKTVLVSDLSGMEINEKDAAQVVIRYKDARRGQVILDVNADEVEDLARKGQRQAQRTEAEV